jgi:hypothetical protein
MSSFPSVLTKMILEYAFEISEHSRLHTYRPTPLVHARVSNWCDWVCFMTKNQEESSIQLLLNCAPESSMYGYVYRWDYQGGTNKILCHIKDFIANVNHYIYEIAD